MRVNINTTVSIETMQGILEISQLLNEKKSTVVEKALNEYLNQKRNKQGKFKKGLSL
jgi:hypothetical protein